VNNGASNAATVNEAILNVQITITPRCRTQMPFADRIRSLARGCDLSWHMDSALRHQWCATSITNLDPAPGPCRTNTRKGNLARTPSPIVDCPSKEPAQAI
jgi:hypothetical protein